MKRSVIGMFENAVKTFLFLFVLSICLNTDAQTVLRPLLSLPRDGDKLLWQQITYCPPGGTGEDIVWDFSDCEFLPYTEQISYTGSLDSLLCMNRNRTSYKYRLSGDSLFCLGHENYTSQITYLAPVVWLHYPFAYGDTLTTSFVGKGSYSHTLPLTTYGYVNVSADACGTLLLPEGDTLRNALRIRRSEIVGQYLNSPEDTMALSSSSTYEAVIDRLNRDSVFWQIDAYQWYIPGYRYPVLESMETSFSRAGHSSRHFSRSMFYSPAEQRYLEDDPDNVAVREESVLEHRSFRLADRNSEFFGRSEKKQLSDIRLSCVSKDNDGQYVLNYRLDRNANVEVLLVTVSGMVIYHEPVHPADPGSYSVNIDISQHHEADFVLSVIVDGENFNRKIMR